MRISYWSSDVCSSDLRHLGGGRVLRRLARRLRHRAPGRLARPRADRRRSQAERHRARESDRHRDRTAGLRSEEHTSELQSLMRNSYAVFCLTKKTNVLHISYENTHLDEHTINLRQSNPIETTTL